MKGKRKNIRRGRRGREKVQKEELRKERRKVRNGHEGQKEVQENRYKKGWSGKAGEMTGKIAGERTGGRSGEGT
jgi:hypothetical protein